MLPQVMLYFIVNYDLETCIFIIQLVGENEKDGPKVNIKVYTVQWHISRVLTNSSINRNKFIFYEFLNYFLHQKCI